MKERPILFSAPMVRALLDGRKTQTRRVIKKATGLSLSVGQDDEQPDIAVLSWLTGAGPGYDVDEHVERVRCPYGAIGDRLWVRETWYVDDYRVQKGPYLKPDDYYDVHEERQTGGIVYRADGDAPFEAEQPVWRPSIHMPRWVSRIDLEITGLRIEHVQSISEADAQAEGVESPEVEREERNWNICPRCGGTRLYTAFSGGGACPDTDCMECDTHAKRFRHLWAAINGENSWAANPWVWVIEFKRITP